MELPAGWVRASLSEISNVVSGATPKTGVPEYWGGNIPWLTPDDLSKNPAKRTRAGRRFLTQNGYDSCSTRMVPMDSVLFSSRAPIGYVTIAGGDICTNQGFKTVIPTLAVYPDYLYWYLQYKTPEIAARASGTTFKEISAKAFAETKVELPPLAEQYRIVEALEDHLSRLDAASESLDHAQALIPIQLRGLYTAATEGRLETDADEDVPDFLDQRRHYWQSTQSKKYKEPIAPDPDYTPHTPTGWRVYSLEALTDPARVIRYGILMPKVKSGGTVPYVEVKDLRNCTLHGKQLHLTSKDLDEQFAGARVHTGDVLLAVRGSYDRSAVAPANLKGANVSRDVARIAPLPGVDPEYLHLYLQSSFAQRYLKAHARGVAVKGVNIASIRALPVSVPSPTTQRQIVEQVQQQLTAVKAAATAVALASTRSASLRRALLNRAFSGMLVPQDSTDEPASILLDRIRAERAANGSKPKRAARRPRKTEAPPPPPSVASVPPPTTAVQQELPL
ncbi:restriction endonuclease subunit S [Streptomyces lydicus]|uniref:restriction endonuclease subunit S n=1 Tax=Streptomyces lydicus TaxID=47763 RepID=UPI003323740A